MRAAIITVGSELTSGASLDSNSQWLSTQLTQLGISVRLHVTVADDIDEIANAIHYSVDVADVVIITGGLGPTLDDLTRQALASVSHVSLQLHQPSLDYIRSLFAKRGMEMPERNIAQAMFPIGSEPIPNHRGTAPGIWMQIPRTNSQQKASIAALPGVPSEMFAMFHEQVVPRLPVSARVIRQLRINCFGVGESKAEELLGDLTERGREPEVGITVHQATITLRITAQGPTEEECLRQIRTAREAAYDRLGELVFGEEDDELQHVVVRLLNEKGLSLATVESGTGLLAHLLAGVSASQSCILGGVVVPSVLEAGQFFDIDHSQWTKPGEMESEIAGALAIACRERFGSDCALAVVTPPDYSTFALGSDVASPSVTVALSTSDSTKVRQQPLFGNRELMENRTAKIAMNLLRRHLIRPSTEDT